VSVGRDDAPLSVHERVAIAQMTPAEMASYRLGLFHGRAENLTARKH
jgi:hypothetical protein